MAKKQKNTVKEPNKIKKFFNTLMYVRLGLILTFQVLGLIGVSMSNVNAIKESEWLIPTWIAAIYLIGMSVLLCKVWKKKERLSIIPLILGVVGAFMAMIVALALRAALPLQVAGTTVRWGGLQGLNGWRLFWRHYSPAIVGVIAAVVSFIHHKSLRDERIRKENESYKETFNFDEDNPLLAKEEPKKEKKKSKKERRAEKE